MLAACNKSANYKHLDYSILDFKVPPYIYPYKAISYIVVFNTDKLPGGVMTI